MKLFKKRGADRGRNGGEGRRNAATSPSIGADAVRGKTSHPAPADDVGVPPHEMIAQEEQKARQAEGEDQETHVEHTQD